MSPKGVTLEESNGHEACRTQVDTQGRENRKSSLRMASGDACDQGMRGLREVGEERRTCEEAKDEGDWFVME